MGATRDCLRVAFFLDLSEPSLVSCGLRGRRKNAIEAKVKSFLGIMVGPGSVKDEHDRGAGERAAVEERNGIREMRVVDFGEGRGAKVERFFDGGDEFFFGVGFGELGSFGSCYTGNFGAKEIVGLGDMKSEMSERHLAWRGLEGKFVGRHGFRSGDHVFGGASEAETEGVAHRICGGWRRRGLRESQERRADECGENGEFADHVISFGGREDGTPLREGRQRREMRL